MSVNFLDGFNDLKRHIGHEIHVVSYGEGKRIYNVAIECETCDEILLDFDRPEVEKAKRARGELK